MTTPDLATEAGRAHSGHGNRLSAAERKLLASVKVYVDSLSGISAGALTSGDLLVSDGVNWINKALSGDATITSDGVLTIGAKKVTAAKTALANGKVLIGGAGGAAAEQTLSGDITTTNTGVTAIGVGKVLLAMLGAGITPSHVVKFAGKFTTAGGAAAEDQTLAGVVAGDVVIYSLQDKGATPRTILTGKPGTDKITWTFSGDPATDHIVSYQVLRAAT